MQGSMTVSAIENGFLVHGGFVGTQVEWPSTMYFDYFEDALDYIREQAGKAIDAELGDELSDADFELPGEGWWSEDD